MPVSGELQYLPAAREALAVERDRVTAERDAFGSFHDRIRSLEPASTGQMQPGGSLSLTSDTANTLDRVRTAYRETVMAVDHYGEEYDEPFAVNMAHEFGDEVTEAVVANSQLTLPLKQKLLKCSRLARENRTDFLALLSREATAIREAERTLEQLQQTRKAKTSQPPLNCSYTELVSRWQDLRTLEDEYTELCEKRQSQLERRRQRNNGIDNMPTLCSHIYHELPVTHPLLAETLDQLKRVRLRRDHVLWFLIRFD